MRLIDVDELMDELCSDIEHESFGEVVNAEILEWIDAHPVVLQWHKLIFRPLTEEEKEIYSNQEWTYMIDGLPDLGEEVLVTNGKRVWIDSFDIDDFVYLSGTDNEVDGVKAWMELPKLYEED
ncbi:MAG: hypothetical protein PUK21_01450 [Peptostreptococcaceae bacterium]|nr:hypothetical protein [Peptostreptococcaceae bacterium]MDY5738674.1 hypothetical protein [Anaerovoracaceae bacterium]